MKLMIWGYPYFRKPPDVYIDVYRCILEEINIMDKSLLIMKLKKYIKTHEGQTSPLILVRKRARRMFFSIAG